MKKNIIAYGFILFSLLAFYVSAQQPLAFSGAQGFGKYTQGGAGGQVYQITSLLDDPNNPQPGTLRHAIKQKGSRIVVFNVSGFIQLKAPLKIRHGFITIAGQTSPQGIGVRGDTVSIKAEQVIIRYVRFRLGSIAKDEDALTVRDSNHVIIDHCSISWGVDETASLYNNRNTTLQHTLISESLNKAGHDKGAHGYGGIWGGASVSFINNVVAHHTSRTPRINGYRLKPTFAQDENFSELVNNVFYNWQHNNLYGGENARFNLSHNVYIPGPASKKQRFFEFYPAKTPNNLTKAYIAHNVFRTNEAITKENKLGVKFSSKIPPAQHAAILANTPLFPLKKSPLKNAISPTELFMAKSPIDVYKKLIIEREVGANRNALGFFLDSVDTRVLADIEHQTTSRGTQGIIDTELQSIESWPVYLAEFSANTKPYTDKNKDGIADTWYQHNGSTLNNQTSHIEQYIDLIGAF